MSALAAIHLAADNPLCILHGDSALSIVDIDDEHDDCHCAEVHQHCNPPLEVTGDAVADGGDDARGEAGDDAGKEYHGDTVADAMLCNLLAKPHDESGAGGEGQDDDYRREDVALSLCHEDVIVLDEHVVSEALKKANRHGGVAGDGGYLLSAFLALILAHALKCRDSDAQKLNDNGCIDVGLDAQREDGRVGERTAGHNVQQAKNRVLHVREVLLKCCNVDVRYRYSIT